MLNRQSYTVGWICASTTDYAAAKAILDEEHPILKRPASRDGNTYTLGKIAEHNVVLTILPDGKDGLTETACLGRDMMHTFPNIKIGLTVGVAGGAPGAGKDIRLGDVVVGSGVVQYDAGTAMQDKGFLYSEKLNQPPTVLRLALNGLEARHKVLGNTIHPNVVRILERYPHMKEEFGRPGLDSDKLFKSYITHKSLCADAPRCCRDTRSSNLVERPDRSARLDDPMTHYGLVGSGNTLMKDARKRDEIARKRGILCFELEAAGLVAEFPCVVIRGISNYADSHKNDEWRGYAAMAAAAYGKDLLSSIPGTKVEADIEIGDVLDWLATDDYSVQQNDYLELREPGTGEWFLKAVEYQHWMQSPGNLLLCPGIPGAGKTVIASSIVNDLHEEYDGESDVGVAYIYFNHRRRETQTVRHLLATILRQFAEDGPHLYDAVREIYNVHRNGRKRPSVDALVQGLEKAAALQSRQFLVIDALDVCQIADGCRERFLSVILSLQEKHGLSVLITSRELPNITRRLSEGIVLEIRASQEDISAFVDECISRSGVPLLHMYREMIKMEITRIAHGVFRLARLHYNMICIQRTPWQLKMALDSGHPKTVRALSLVYEEAWAHDIKRITATPESDCASAEIARTVLLLIVCSDRGLTIPAVQHALAVITGSIDMVEENILEVDDVISACGGLVKAEVNQENSITRLTLIHDTLREYLELTQSTWFPDAHSLLATTCLEYLLSEASATGLCTSDRTLEARLRSNAFYEYAARSWEYHVRNAAVTDCTDNTPTAATKAKKLAHLCCKARQKELLLNKLV
ncbi:nucleoside phosphorylase [Aspergillus desertorum]